MAVPLGLCLSAAPAHAALTLEDYKYLRALSTDLVGRIPTRAELAAFEKPGFDVNAWVDQQLQKPGYAERLTRIYADLLRPQLSAQFRYTARNNFLATLTYKAPSGKLTRLYYRPGQLRTRTTALRATLNKDTNYKACIAIKSPATDPLYVTLNCAQYEKYDNLLKAGSCLTADEIGVRYQGGLLKPIPFPTLPTDVNGDPPRDPAVQAALDANTVVVKPWWLYADYRAAAPADRYNATTWATKFPGYLLATSTLKEPDNTTDTMDIRVCKEEVQADLTAAADNAAIKTPVSCLSGYGVAQSSKCGCGAGLELCLPAMTGDTNFPVAAFTSSRNVLLGVDDPADQTGFDAFDWQTQWMTQEPRIFLSHLFSEDRDLREMVTARYTYINGPLAQFYRFSARAFWPDATIADTPLPDPADIPTDLLPQDVLNWRKIGDRGANAAGLLTQPWFLLKNATRRARGHVVYNAFLCRDFVAPAGLQLPISSEPNLMRRPGCDACHQTLEPLAAYFSRLVENDWSWLDPTLYPAQNPTCKQTTGAIPTTCNSRYDNVFSTAEYGMLRGAYADTTHADGGPAALGQVLVGKPEYARCAAQNVAVNFLGRDLRTEDAALLDDMTSALTAGGYRARAMVKVLLKSNAYRSANNLNSTVWRKGGTP